MKKQFLLLLTLLLCSTAAWAATEYGIYVAGTKVTSDNCNNIVNNYITGGTVVYTPSSKTLTLTNVTINTGTTSNNGINNYDCDDLNIRFVGTCNITVNNYDKQPLSTEEKTYMTIVSGTTTFKQLASNGECIWIDSHGTQDLHIYGPGKLVLNAPDGHGITCRSTDNGAGIAYPSAPVYYQNGCDLTINAGRNGLRRGYHLFYDCNVTIKATNNSEYPNVAVQRMFYYNGAVITTPDGAEFDYSGSSQYNNVKVNGNAVYTQDIVITNQYYLLLNSTNFPDANFRAYMHLLYPKGYMTQAEVNNRTTLDVSGKGIANMKGIEKLTALKELRCYSNTFTSLDLSSNTALTYLDCAPNSNLTSLNVASCTNLETLICYRTGITSLNVNDLSKLKMLRCYETKLTSLYVTGKSNLTELNCSNCTSLTSLNCSRNNLTTLNVTGNTALKELRCYENANLAYITGMANCTAITYLDCEDCKITDLSAVNSMLNIEKLYARNNKLTKFEITKQMNYLKYIRLSGNTLMTSVNLGNAYWVQTLDVSGCTALTTLNAGVGEDATGSMTSLNVTGCTALTTLWVYRHALSSITGIASCTALADVDIRYNAFTDLSFCNNFNNLTTLDCGGNSNTTLTITNKSKLKEVGVYNSSKLASLTITGNPQLTTLGMSYCPALTTVDCYNNKLSSLNYNNSTAITTLKCYRNALTSLNVSSLTKLTQLRCFENPSLASITGLANTASTLTYLDADDCNLASLDVSSLSKLQTLRCRNNRITSLNVQGKTALQTLYCNGNQLTSLYVQGCTALLYLECHRNKFTDAGMTTLVNSLPTRSASSKGTLRVLYNTGENNVFTSAHAAAAAAKNWVPYRYNGTTWVVITASTPGDVNGDGQVNISDVTDLIDLLLAGTGAGNAAADVNGDGQVNISDVTDLIDMLLSK